MRSFSFFFLNFNSFTVTSTHTSNDDLLKDWAEIRKVSTELLEELNIHISDRARVHLKGVFHNKFQCICRSVVFIHFVKMQLVSRIDNGIHLKSRKKKRIYNCIEKLHETTTKKSFAFQKFVDNFFFLFR